LTDGEITYLCWVCGERFKYEDVGKHGSDGHEKDPQYKDKIEEKIRFKTPLLENPKWEKELKDVEEPKEIDDTTLL